MSEFQPLIISKIFVQLHHSLISSCSLNSARLIIYNFKCDSKVWIKCLVSSVCSPGITPDISSTHIPDEWAHPWCQGNPTNSILRLVILSLKTGTLMHAS